MTTRSTAWRFGHVGWLTLALLVATLAVNIAGIRDIARARKGVTESSRRFARIEVEARARAIEGTLSTIRADLRFLSGAPALAKFPPGSVQRAPELSILAAVGADLILFLRGHPEVASMTYRSPSGAALLEAGRPRGIPGYWIPAGSSSGSRSESVQSSGIRGSSPIFGRADSELAAASLELALAGPVLVGGPTRNGASHLSCALADSAGALFVVAPDFDSAASDVEEVAVATEGWSVAGPWRLRCVRGTDPAIALLEPIASRYRGAILLNLAIMALALALGMLAIHQARRRRWLEAREQEHARVRELERQLFHAERLATVGRLAAGMAHEINNPLAGLSNYLRLARDAVVEGDGSAALRHLGRVDEGAQRAAGIVRRVLDHTDPATPQMVPLNLNDVLRQAVEFVGSREEFSAIRFDSELAGTELVNGSALMLGQVFLNLLLNACEAQPEGGDVFVHTWRDGAWVVAEVADRGPGVPQPLRERIFEPFQTTKNSSGLGLSICDTIVRQHGGELTVDSRPSGGARFRVRLAAVPSIEEAG